MILRIVQEYEVKISDDEIEEMKKAGVDLDNPEDIAEYLDGECYQDMVFEDISIEKDGE